MPVTFLHPPHWQRQVLMPEEVPKKKNKKRCGDAEPHAICVQVRGEMGRVLTTLLRAYEPEPTVNIRLITVISNS